MSAHAAATAPPATAALVLAGAARAIAMVLAQGRSADVALAAPELCPGHPALRSAIRAVTLGSLRWYLRLAPAVLPLVGKPGAPIEPLLRALLVGAVHQLEYSPHRAAATVAAAVDAARLLGLARAAALCNAVLRRYLRERAGLLAAVDRDQAARTAHPAWFVHALAQAWPGQVEQVLAANNAHPPLVLRVDRSRVSVADYLRELEQAGLAAAAVPGIDTAIALGAAVAVTELPGFAAGRVSVQDASAQLASQLLAPRPGERVLDACAAPGGKSGALLERAGGPIELVALDLDAVRLGRVAENLARLGRSAQLVQADLGGAPDWWDGRAFDAILLDAPCSASGVLRRHPDIKVLRRAGDIPALAATQLALLKASWRLLRAGGRLLYCTCSVLPAENSQVIGQFLAEEPGARALDLPLAGQYCPPLRPCAVGWQMLPGERAGGDGFYYACLTR
jgi:16S rRNA (cytosine967-C5)-methyltransferase